MSSMIRIANGLLIDPLRLRPEDVYPEAIIHSLSMLPRYGGHTIAPYFVGEHTVKLVDVVPQHLKKAALIHDFSEGCGFTDLVRPVKRHMPQYSKAEERAQQVIFERFNVDWSLMEELHDWDQRICQDEAMQVFSNPVNYGLEPVGITVDFWSWQQTLVALRFEAEALGVL